MFRAVLQWDAVDSCQMSIVWQLGRPPVEAVFVLGGDCLSGVVRCFCLANLGHELKIELHTEMWKDRNIRCLGNFTERTP